MKKGKKRRNFRTSRNALWLIAAILLGSSALRVAVGANGAIALESDSAASEAMHSEAEMLNKASEQEKDVTCENGAKIAEILQDLSKREEVIAEREGKLRDRIAALSLVEEEVQRNLVALEEAEKKLAKTLALADEAAENDIARLTSVYENMKPKDAALLFQEMPPEFAARFLGRMRAESAAAIMAGLDSTSAYSISVVLAGRNANVPTE